MVEDFKTANNISATGKEKEIREWRPPPEGIFLINVDGECHFGRRFSANYPGSKRHSVKE